MDSTEQLEIPSVFPSETVFQIKQRIAAMKGGAKEWMPLYQFLATETRGASGGGASGGAVAWKPADVRWPFETVPNPLNPRTTGKPDPRLYADGERVVGNPVFLSSLLLSDVFSEDEERVLHVWNLRTVYAAADRSTAAEVFIGFYQLYFPQLQTIADLEAAAAAETAAEKQASTELLAFVASNQEKLHFLDTLLRIPTKPSHFHELRQLSFDLSVKDVGSLELLFYNTEASMVIPFLRYFPSQARVTPLVKYSTAAITDPRLFESLMSDQPGATEAILLMKVPITHPRAPFGTAWTLRITSLRVEVSIGAPRRDMPLKADIVRRAAEQLAPFLAATPFAAAPKTLANLNAVYALNSPLHEKPTKQEWATRIRPFLSLFHTDVMLHGDKAAFSLRYKAVSNYKKDTDPQMAYLTTLFLRDATASEGSIPVASYISSLISEFGIGTQEATVLLQRWLANEAKEIQELKEGSDSERERYIKLHPMGVSVSLYNNHPNYLVAIAGCDNLVDLQRIVSLMSVFVSAPAGDFAAAAAAAEPLADGTDADAVVADGGEEAIADAYADGGAGGADGYAVVADGGAGAADGAESRAMWDAMNFSGDFGEEVPIEETVIPEPEGAFGSVPDSVPGSVPDSVPVPAVAANMPLRLGATEIIHPIVDKWYLEQFKRIDPALFDYTRESGDKRVQLYSSRCQFNVHKQPNIMTYEEYTRAKTLYGNSVFWVETPLQGATAMAIDLATKTPGERIKTIAKTEPHLSKADQLNRIVELEAIALTRGFTLHKESVTLLSKDTTAEQKARITQLTRAQTGKDLWVVVRAGTHAPNYYICAEFWCVRDSLPLIAEEYHGRIGRDNKPKDKDTCAFCGGGVIKDRKNPKRGETVIVRPPQATADKVAKYAGFLGELYHPLKFALPCCFTTLRNIIPPPDSIWPAAIDAEEEATDNPVAPTHVLSQAEKNNRNRPFSAKALKSAAQNHWYIPAQNVIGRTADRTWIEVERGGIAVPPTSVNTLLGQNPEQFLTKNKGVLGDKINSYLGSNTTAFVRYGIEHNGRQPGLQFQSLLCYAQYACAFLTNENAIMEERADMLERVLNEREIAMVRGLEQAGYGTLLHEMSKVGDVRDGDLAAWCLRMGIAYDSATNKAESKVLYLAWENFKNYLQDLTVTKDFRLWDSLLATPGLLTDTGVVLVVIRVPKNKSEKATFQCPSMGVALAHVDKTPPFLFLVMDEESGQYDPLVLYESSNKASGGAGAAAAAAAAAAAVAANESSKEIKRMLGVLSTSVSLSKFSPTTQDILSAFFKEYTDTETGCGRSIPPIHPWMPVATRGTLPIPFVSDLEAFLFDGIVAKALLRDRSNRLVGVKVEYSGKEFYIPLLDDGTLHTKLPSIRGESGLPYTDLPSLFNFYGTLLSPRYPALKPVQLLPNADNTHIIALNLASGVTVPCDPFLRSRSIDGPLYAEVVARGIPLGRREMPWKQDAELLLRPEITDGMGETSEEILTESYEQLRLSFGHWLAGREGRKVADHIERLRQARRVLPLWELQKRLEYLLIPILHKFVTTEGDEGVSSHKDVLRRDCLLSKQSECHGGCSWIVDKGQCLIHTKATSRYRDPVRLLTVRLVDELLQTFDLAHEILDNRVSAIKPLEPGAILRTEDSVLFSATGSSTDELLSRLGYDQRKPTHYTRGLTFPEEVNVEAELAADYGTLKPAVLSAAMSRDRRVGAIAFLAGYLGITAQALELETGRPWTFSLEDWQHVANRKRVTVLLHAVDPASHTLTVDRIVMPEGGSGERPYILVDPNGLLFRDTQTGKMEFTKEELPPSLRVVLS